MSGSVYRDAYAIGRYVDGKVRRLQTAYLGESPLSSAARAELAFLRHSNGEARWVPGGEILFEGLPDLQLSARDEDRMLLSVGVALGLYAWHQQSRKVPMAFTPEDGQHRSFGCSCRLIQPKLDEAAGVKRRLAALEAAPGVREMGHHFRRLVRLMRDASVQVDYFSLARDLYLLQHEATRSNVFMHWSRDYYASMDDESATK